MAESNEGSYSRPRWVTILLSAHPQDSRPLRVAVFSGSRTGLVLQTIGGVFGEAHPELHWDHNETGDGNVGNAN